MFENVELEYSESCPICLELLYEPYRAGPCNHVFCKLCIVKVEEMNQVFDTKCPYCRQQVMYYQFNGALALKMEKRYQEWYEYKRSNDKGSKNVPFLAFDMKVLFGILLFKFGLLWWFDKIALLIMSYFPIFIHCVALLISLIIRSDPVPNNGVLDVPRGSRNQSNENSGNS